MDKQTTPRQIGPYFIDRRLGQGGMAEVFLAHQPSLNRSVALKLMLGHLANNTHFIKRFQREAQAIGRLRHPHIMNVFDFGLDDETYYMVMEYIPGGTLKDALMQRGPLPLTAALRVTMQLADALEYAHSNNMIHRDVKPANVMFTDNTLSHAILGDFGIALLIDEQISTSDGKTIGTPAYMSPEVIAGQPADPRSDLYGLGIMLYEMLSGQLPFRAEHPMAILMKHIQSDPPDLTPLNLPDSSEALLMRLMAKNPKKRFESAAEVRDLILAIQNQEAVTIEKPQWTPDDEAFLAMLSQTPLLNIRLINSLPITFDQNRRFYARRDHLHDLARWIELGDTVVWVDGIAGIGKTALVSKVLGDVLSEDDIVDGVVCLSGRRGGTQLSLARVVQDFARLMPKVDFSAAQTGSTSARIAAFLEAVKRGRYALLLDNMPADGDNLPELMDLLTAVLTDGGLSLLVTSRTPYPLKPTDNDRLHLLSLSAGLSLQDALAFMRHLPAGADLPPDDELEVLVAETNGHPRALEAATDWLSLNPLGSIDELLDELDDLLEQMS